MDINGIKITPVPDNAQGSAWDALRLWNQDINDYRLIGKRGSRFYYQHLGTGEYAMVNPKRGAQSNLDVS
ncbi:hypothetical protein LCGC14_0378750 [marine sediment metagenome]|uniref:Uncharacterized protein n=1 Tax=marine sediment metagenome TaxID=412755 RepID=A0A0F9TL42_9ZZZZ